MDVLTFPPSLLIVMKKTIPALLSFAWLTMCPAQVPANPNPIPAPVELTRPVHEEQPTAVPETVGATLIAGVGFLMIFGRRRY